MIDIKVEAASHLRRKFITALVPSILRQLKIERNRFTLVIIVDELEAEAATVPLINLDSILIVIKPQSLRKIGVALAHELIHVKQFVKGQLRQIDETRFFWCGKEYDTTGIDYTHWPWETQAYSQQEIIFRRAYEGTA